MIPANRPVLGKDLDAVRQQFGLLVSDAIWLFGLSITRWTQIVRNNPDEPVKDPTLALLVRFLDQHADMAVIPKFPSAEEMFKLINDVADVDQKRFSVLFGSEASAAYRWLKAGSRQTPAVTRLMHYLQEALVQQPPRKRGQLLESWRNTVAQEATARGVEDIFKTGQWNPKTKAAKATRAKKAASPKAPEAGADDAA